MTTPSSGAPRHTLRIGGASASGATAAMGAPQLVASGLIDVLVFDYLAELTMSILAAARLKRPREPATPPTSSTSGHEAGAARGGEARHPVISNAGGINPQACARALQALAAAKGWR
jgi:hypothetical protein